MKLIYFGIVSLWFTVLVGCSGGFQSVHLPSLSLDAGLGTNDLAITSPPEQFNSKGSIELAGKCANGYEITISGDLLAPAQASCTFGNFSAQIQLSVGEGPKNILVSQKDSSGRNHVSTRIFQRDSV